MRPTIPCFKTKIIETHCHLDYLVDGLLNAAVHEAEAVGIDRLITIAVSEENLSIVRKIAGSFEQVWCTQGIHPHEAQTWNHQLELKVRDGCMGNKVVALGEIGLDYHYDHSDRKIQADAFEAQLSIAAELSLPVVIHTREADEDTKRILSNHSKGLTKKGVIHSFTSSMDLAEFCLSEGFMLGFNGITTFKNADNVRQIVRATPIDRLVLETDAPYLTPVPYRGKSNAPCYLPFIAENIAKVKEVEIELLLKQVRQNSNNLFF